MSKHEGAKVVLATTVVELDVVADLVNNQVKFIVDQIIQIIDNGEDISEHNKPLKKLVEELSILTAFTNNSLDAIRNLD